MGFLRSIVTGIATALLGDDDDERDLINQQIRSYREQTEITRKELALKKDQVELQKRRVQEKSIRSLKRNYSNHRGLLGSNLGSSNSGMQDMSEKLGG